jgi:hypothetical protein
VLKIGTLNTSGGPGTLKFIQQNKHKDENEKRVPGQISFFTSTESLAPIVFEKKRMWE